MKSIAIWNHDMTSDRTVITSGGNVTVIGPGAMQEFEGKLGEEVLAGGCADMVSMARPFLADADFVVKAAAGRADEINTCIGCNQACLDHTFSNKRASCLVNPRACHETELVYAPAKARRKVAVIGFCMGGALTLAAAVHFASVDAAAATPGRTVTTARLAACAAPACASSAPATQVSSDSAMPMLELMGMGLM